MVDNLSVGQRRKNMQSIRSTNTKLENKVTRELWSRGIRFRKNVKSLKGKPDIAIKKHKVVIFIDSCFWHSCKLHGTIPKTNQEYWVKKINRNKERDKEVTEYYLSKGWNILRIWEHELKDDFQETINKIQDFINNKKGRKK